MIVGSLSVVSLLSLVAFNASPHGWSEYASRGEIRPEFSVESESETGRGLVLVIAAGDRPAIDGAWIKKVPVSGGRHYEFRALRRTDGVASPRRSAIAKIIWQDEQGQRVRRDDGDLARPEYPRDQPMPEAGWTQVADTYLAPRLAKQARVELHLRWTSGSVRWRDVELVETKPPKPRLARLATVHFRPREGRTNREKREQFAPLIAEAANRKADVVCLPESLTYYRSRRPMVECAETIPGPSTDYFGQLAKKHDLYIVAGLTEREGSVVYNTAVLVGPDGGLLGKYRKVCLPREEIEAGLTPGERYPVFETRFGNLGMMICWDVQFPEVARHLANNGAEVIAMPIWGGNPTLARARAIENQIHLISSTYSEIGPDAMVSGVWDRRGNLLVQNDSRWGQVFVAEVDLDQRTRWDWLGDLRARIDRERPAGGFPE